MSSRDNGGDKSPAQRQGTGIGEKGPLKIAILGAGMSGLCMAIQLKKAGIGSFKIYEKCHKVGGTWRDNTYPGLACDVPSHLYSFSFEPNLQWSHLFSPGWEIQEYFERCVETYDLGSYIQFNTEIVNAEFDNDVWRLRAANGEEITAHVVITGVGALHNPKYPDIAGLESFAGTQFHSARWNHDHDLTGRNVAVIGSAASAVQIVPQIAQKTNQLYVFQRTANWIRPRSDRAYSSKLKTWFRRLPFLARLYRWIIYWRMEALFPVFLQKGPANRGAKKLCLSHLNEQISDRNLQRALTPDYPPGCKRILISDDFYPVLERDNVELVTDPIERVDPDGIVTRDGKLRKVDTIVLATGFHATKLLAPMKVTGRSGLTLDEAWKNGAEAHRTVTIPGFPNFFMLLGPNSALGHNSIIFMVEAQVRYIMQCLKLLIRRDLMFLTARKKAADQYNHDVQNDMKTTIWSAGCKSWYQDDNGKVVALWPRSSLRFWREMRRMKPSEFEQVERH